MEEVLRRARIRHIAVRMGFWVLAEVATTGVATAGRMSYFKQWPDPRCGQTLNARGRSPRVRSNSRPYCWAEGPGVAPPVSSVFGIEQGPALRGMGRG
jgi:hypothetical protein